MSILDKINGPSDLKKLNIDELNVLAQEVRELIINTIMTNGGHLSPNLGVVELTLALHYVFDVPNDKLIFDVGHQSYTHKIITGRKNEFSTLRKNNGISGFPKMSESKYDCANTGHASTSISLGCGYAFSCQNNVISVIGDGALTGGLAYEAINDIFSNHNKQIVVINDNNMSISKNSIFVEKILASVKNASQSTHNFFKDILDYKFIENGNDIQTLIDGLEWAKKCNKSVILHVCTKKGLGYQKSMEDPEKYHGYSPCCDEKESFSCHFGKKLLSMAECDSDIVAVTPAMQYGTGLSLFEKTLPQQFIDVGIAEGHALTMSSGLALGGKKPYVAIYSTFLQRAFDNLLHDVCLQDANVTICLDRAGIVADDGETHQGIYDISYTNCMPNLSIFAPKDYNQLDKALEFSRNYNHPFIIRYPKGSISYSYSVDNDLQYGQWEKLTNTTSKLYIITSGATMVQEAMRCKDLLEKESIEINVVNACFVKPMDIQMLDNITNSKIIVLEDNVDAGSLGSNIINYYNNKNNNNTIFCLNLGNNIDGQATVEEILEKHKLDCRNIAKFIKEINC